MNTDIDNRLDAFIEFAEKTRKHHDADFYRQVKAERDQLRTELEKERERVKELERVGQIILSKIQTNLNAISVVDANNFAAVLSAGEGGEG